jgi:hypothetical protein
MSVPDLARIERIVEHVLVPLVTGGDLRPVPPIGTDLALRLSTQATSLESDSDVALARLARARELWPVDRVPPMRPGEWLLLFALNDLIQAANPDLPGVLRQRPFRLLMLVEATVERAGAPRSVADALARDATFARVLEVARPDTHVAWWVGSGLFQGTKPPARLLAWPNVRRVRSTVDRVRIPDLAAGRHQLEPTYRRAVATFFAASPLTDLGGIDRSEPPFAWTGATLGLIRSERGRTLAERVIRARCDAAAAAREATRAAQALSTLGDETEPEAIEARQCADAFAHALSSYAADRAYAGSARRAFGT